jgi:internalin A
MIETSQTKLRPRSRLRLTLGGMMLIVLLIGGWLGWMVHRAKVQREAVAAIVKAGGNVLYDWELGKPPGAKPNGPKWLRDLIGIDYFDTVVAINANRPAVDDAVVAHIGRLTHVTFLGLQDSTVTDVGLAKLAGLHKLRNLLLRTPNVNGSSFRHLSGLRGLCNLHFVMTPITDENLAYLLPLTSIQKLSLFDTRITDAGMKDLARMSGLQKIWLQTSGVGDEGLRELGRHRGPLTVELSSRANKRVKTRITPQGIEAMKKLAPKLVIVP